jgi:hypothetical protein
MAFEVKKTLGLIRGGLLDAEATWKVYLAENPPWQQTVMVLTGPLLVANVLLSLVFSRLVGGYSAFGYQSGWFSSLFIGLLTGAAAVIITSIVFNVLAGPFKGTSNFSRAFAAVSLAVIPAWVAGMLSALIPYLGALVAIAGGILSLVYMYRIMPLALNVPQEKRALHFIVSLVLIVIVNMAIAAALGVGGASPDRDFAPDKNADRAPATTGIIGEIARQGELMQAAGADTYVPPTDGKLNEDQVKAYVSVMQKAHTIQEEYAEKMQQLSANMEADKAAGKNLSLSDLRNAYSGVGSIMSANNADMEVVKSGGGNWAEHEWVKQKLRTAKIQQGQGSAANAYNYTLYQKYAEALGRQ